MTAKLLIAAHTVSSVPVTSSRISSTSGGLITPAASAQISDASPIRRSALILLSVRQFTRMVGLEIAATVRVGTKGTVLSIGRRSRWSRLAKLTMNANSKFTTARKTKSALICLLPRAVSAATLR